MALIRAIGRFVLLALVLSLCGPTATRTEQQPAAERGERPPRQQEARGPEQTESEEAAPDCDSEDPSGAAAETEDEPELAEPRHDVPGVPNFAKVSDTLYRGGQPTAEGMRRLKEMGIRTVVNLRSFHSDRDELRGTGLRYAHIYCKAWNPEDEDVVEFLKTMSDPDNHPVFVHCQRGADRTGYMVAVYRMVEQGWTAERAAEEMHNFDFHPIWQQIIRYLRKFDPEEMREKVAEAPAVDIDVIE